MNLAFPSSSTTCHEFEAWRRWKTGSKVTIVWERNRFRAVAPCVCSCPSLSTYSFLDRSWAPPQSFSYLCLSWCTRSLLVESSMFGSYSSITVGSKERAAIKNKVFFSRSRCHGLKVRRFRGLSFRKPRTYHSSTPTNRQLLLVRAACYHEAWWDMIMAMTLRRHHLWASLCQAQGIDPWHTDTSATDVTYAADTAGHCLEILVAFFLSLSLSL